RFFSGLKDFICGLYKNSPTRQPYPLLPNSEPSYRINELQQLNDEDRQHILKTLGALIREPKTKLTFG
ncbi:hypothetical protein, partial [Fulvivirga kasyanovii]|uniref:hypothetical protein n=1 Tax=Fulvivirga kasyanovii TaxID=396812 RepID=UPI001C867642